VDPTTLTWSVNAVVGGNATLGTISGGGVYTAPAAVPSPAVVTIGVNSVVDGRSSSAAVTLTSGAAVGVSVTPASASVPAGSTQSFSATVANSSNTAVTWQVNGVAGGGGAFGTISAAGLYTAPSAVPTPSTVTVTAVANADTGVSASAQVSVTVPTVTVAAASGGGGGGGSLELLTLIALTGLAGVRSCARRMTLR
jgi:hypothetical protein